MIVVRKGANQILNRPLVASDGTPIPVTAVASVVVELIQKDGVKETLTLGSDAEVRAGTDGFSYDLELTAELSAAMDVGRLADRWTIEIADTDYQVDGEKIRKIEEQEVWISE